MKKFLIFYIILILLGIGYICLDFSRYSLGVLDEYGKVLVPIKYPYVSPQFDYDRLKIDPIGTNFFTSDVYNETGFLFKTKGYYMGRSGNIKLYMGKHLDTQNIYYNDTLIEKDVTVSIPFNYFVIITSPEGKNILNTKTGKNLSPTDYSSVSFKDGLFHAGKGELHELFDINGNKIYSGKISAKNVVKDLVIADQYLYTKDGKKFNNTPIEDYTVFNDNLYIIKDYKPYIYNREKNTFEDTDIDYILPDNLSYHYYSKCFYVHKNGKFGVILDDFESPVVYDDICEFNQRQKAFTVRQGDKFGVIGPNVNIPCKYDEIGIRRPIDSSINIPLNGLYQVYIYNHNNENNFPNNMGVRKKYTKPVFTGNQPTLNPPMVPNKTQVTVVDSFGKELIPLGDNETEIFNKYIIVKKHEKGPTDIYDIKGNKIMSFDWYIYSNSDNITYNSLFRIDKDKYIDLDTKKYYSSPIDFLAYKNPDIPYLKDCKIEKFGRSNIVIYKKPLFKK